jgi:tetratricopeptide (TPR) repeat protein
LSGIVVLSWLVRRRHPVFAFSIFWFFLTLAPTSSIVPILDVIFEHRLYLPMAGICLSFPLLLEVIYGKLKERGIAVPGRAGVYACFILAVLSVGTILRNHVWRDDVRLWQDVATKSPNKIRPYNALVFAHYKRGEFDQAIEAARRGIDRNPGFRKDLGEPLANMYLKAGRFDEAIDVINQLVTEIKDNARLAQIYNNLGVAHLYKWNALQAARATMSNEAFALQRQQILTPAAQAFAKSVELDPDMIWALDSLVNVAHAGDAGSQLESPALEALKNGDSFNNLYVLGKLAFERGDYSTASHYFERAENLKNDEKVLYYNHGYALAILNDQDRAIEKYLQAIRLDPIFIEAHHNVALIYFERKEYSTAIEHFEEVLRQQPEHVTTNLYLARIYISQGNRDLARNHLSTVLKASPGNSQALQLWEQLGS